MVKQPSKYDNSVFTKPEIETDPAKVYEQLVSECSVDSGLQGLVDSIASEVRQWIESDEDKSEAASDTGQDLLKRCKSIRTDFGTVSGNGLRSGPPSQVSLVQLGYQHCQWRIQAYGFERLAGIGRGADRNLLRSKGQPITDQAIALYRNGTSMREVQRQCKVGYRVASRWKKEFNKNS